jgi:WD40 repeat protein
VNGIDAGPGWVVTAGKDATLRVWSTRGLVRVMRSQGGSLHAVRVSHDHRLVAACDDARVSVWNVASGSLVTAWEWGRMPSTFRSCRGLAWSPDDARIAVAAHALRVFTRAGVLVWENLPAEHRGVDDVDWHGARLVYAMTDESIVFARGDSGAIERHIEPFGPLGLYCVRFSPDGRRLAGAYATEPGKPGGSAVVWNVADGRRVMEVRVPRATQVSWARGGVLAVAHEQGATFLDTRTGAVLRALSPDRLWRLGHGVVEGSRMWITTWSGAVAAWGPGDVALRWMWMGKTG